jgi:tripartite-type tricarboxylate transporter receptor subunit TctC
MKNLLRRSDRAMKLALLACALACGVASGQPYPSRPLHLIVPFPAAGPADIFGRGFAAGLSEKLGQPVVVENIAGVGGVIGVDRVAKAAPDGYTLCFNSASPLVIAPFTLKRLPYDVRKDFALITVAVRVPEVLAVHPSLPVRNLAELIAYARANPGKVNFGSAGSGSVTHLAGELFKAEAGVDLVHVPYKGAAPATSDLLGGQVQMAILDVPVLLSHLRSGKLRAIAVTSARRAPSLPDVPTTAEGGYPAVTSDNWYGVVMPAAVPKAIVDRVHAAAVAALESPGVAAQFARVGGVASPGAQQDYAAFVAAEQAKWSRIVRAIGYRED